MERSATVVLLVGGAASAAMVGARLRTWGTRGDEATRALPGEELMLERGAALTHAVTIDAPPERVWPWIAQLGSDKGGFYSYAWLENFGGAGIVNADRIVAAWQDPLPGEALLLHPSLALQIARVVPDELFVAIRPVSVGVGFCWIFSLSPEGMGRTRLVVRERYVVPWPPARMLAAVATCGSAVMSRRMLLGIKERAEAGGGGPESRSGRGRGSPGADGDVHDP